MIAGTRPAGVALADTPGDHGRGHARELDEDTLARRRRVHSHDHLWTLITASNLAKDLEQLGDHQAAAALRAEAKHRRRGQGEAAQVNRP
jgi:hypothetical protein